MLLSELIATLKALEEKHGGDILVITAKDAEGNGYCRARGVDFVFTDEELEYVFDTLEEAGDCDHDPIDLTRAALVWV